ncbi:MAG: ABC transporter permease [Armatimonadia bacterium]
MVGLTRKVGFILLVLTIWQIVVSLHFWSPLLLPGPRSVAQSLVDGVRNLSLPVAVLASLVRMVIGYGLAVLIGLCAGFAMARFDLLRDTLGGAAVGLHTLPSICWLPLALLWFGLNEKAIIFVVVMGATFSIITAVDGGIRNVSPQLIEAGRNLGARGLALQFRVVLPAALPTIVTGLKLGWSFAWRSLMAGELLYSEKGLGRVLTLGRDLGDMAQVLAAMIVILIIGLAVNRLVFGPLETILARRWGLVRD